MEIEDESCINESIFRDGSKELFVTQNITIQRVAWKEMIIFIQQFIKYLKNKVFIVINNDCYFAYTPREKIERYPTKRKLDLNTSGLDSPSDKKLRREDIL